MHFVLYSKSSNSENTDFILQEKKMELNFQIRSTKKEKKEDKQKKNTNLSTYDWL